MIKIYYVAPQAQVYRMVVRENLLQTSTSGSGVIDSVEDDDTWEF